MARTTRGTRTNSVPILHGASLMFRGVRKHLTRVPKDSAMHGGDRWRSGQQGRMKMCLWYGMLYVVVEGWQEAKLSDQSG